MKNSEYWKRRQELLQDTLMQKADDLIPEMEAKYNAAIRNIESEIQIFYQRFADNEGIKLADAKKILNSDERKAFQMELEEYIKKGAENGVSEDWSKQLESASDIYRMDRLKSLQLQMHEQIEELAGYKQQVLSKTLGEIYSEGYYHNIFEVQSLQGYGEAFTILDTDKINKVLSKPWTYDNMSYSDKIWKNRDTLSYTLDKALTQGIIRGDAPDKIAKAITQEVGVELNNAKRLVLTESAAFSALASRDSYKELNVEKFEYMATLDERTCETCGPMDGQIFKMAEYNIGVTVPPLHPSCRCTTAPYFDDEFTAGDARTARNSDGKVYDVPADMKYSEWKTEYIDGGINSGIIENDIQIGKSLGAAAFRDTVLLPDGNYGEIVEGSKITKVVVFAGKEAKKPVRVAEYLSKQYGGRIEDWQHTRGEGFVEVNGEQRRAELHWFENKDVGRIKMKVKRWIDES
ncbi:MAG: minor capsid protein [Candidatus Metalachnospira sp.]|nr:minor capsid protein [Candidatus Metalachnospira sp.]